MDIGAALGDLLTGDKAVGDMVERVTLETRFTPPIVIEKPMAGGAPNPVAQFFMPRITVQTPYGNSVKAPYGEPDANYWPWVKLGGVVLLAVSARLIVRGLRK